jgi:uncharacterized protein
MRRFDLRRLRFGDGSEIWRRLPVEVEPFFFGGLEYDVPEGLVDVLVTLSRVGQRYTVVAEFEADVTGPCQRCLEEAHVVAAARGVEYAHLGDSQGEDEDEGYVSGFMVDLERWVRDLLAEALPQQLLCREDCLGLCPVCGADLNADPGHRHDEV